MQSPRFHHRRYIQIYVKGFGSSFLCKEGATTPLTNSKHAVFAFMYPLHRTERKTVEVCNTHIVFSYFTLT